MITSLYFVIHYKADEEKCHSDKVCISYLENAALPSLLGYDGYWAL